MKAIFTVSGFIKLPGKTIPYAKQQSEMVLHDGSIEGDIASLALLTPRFPFKEALLIDEYESEVKLEGEIPNALIYQVVAILNAKGFTRLDLTNCRMPDNDVANRVLGNVVNSLRTNFEVLEIKLPLDRPLQGEEQEKLNECLLRNKAMKQIMPWYSNPLKNASPAKLLLSFTLLAFVGSWIGLGLTSLFVLSSLYGLTASLLGNLKEKNLHRAWLQDKYMPEEKGEVEKHAILLGQKSRADWRSFGETLYPSQENLEACQHYPAYLVGAVQAEMDKKRASLPALAPVPAAADVGATLDGSSRVAPK